MNWLPPATPAPAPPPWFDQAAQPTPFPPPPPQPPKRGTGWLIGGLVFGALVLLGAVGAANEDDTSYTPPSRSSSSYDSSSYSSSNFEENFVATSCETAMSDPDIAAGYATGYVSAYDLAAAFANGYVPSADSSLTRSEVIAACVRGIRRS